MTDPRYEDPIRPAADKAFARGSETVLVIGENQPMRIFLRNFLEFLGYRVLDTDRKAHAEEICRLYLDPIHLLLVEIDRSREACEIIETLKQLRADMKILLLSSEDLDELRIPGPIPHLEKPFEVWDLARRIREVLAV